MDFDQLERLHEIKQEVKKIDEMLDAMDSEFILDILVTHADIGEKANNNIKIEKDEQDEQGHLDRAVRKGLKERRDQLMGILESHDIVREYDNNGKFKEAVPTKEVE